MAGNTFCFFIEILAMPRKNKYTSVLFPFIFLYMFYNEHILIELEKTVLKLQKLQSYFFKSYFNSCISFSVYSTAISEKIH